MNSVSAFGIVAPVLIDEHNTIIAGEGIAEAARRLGHVEIPTLRIEHLSEGEVRLLRIALNKLAETSEWNTIELSAEFEELLSMDLDVAYEVTGFGTIEVDNLLHAAAAEAEADDPDDDLVPVGDPADAITRIGDMWDLGDHRVLCGSSLDTANIERLMGGHTAVMVLTDHPFNVKIKNNVSGLGRVKHREFVQASGEMSEAEFVEFLSTSIRAMAEFCYDGALLYMYMDWRHVWEMMEAIRAAELTMINVAVWVKRSPAMGAFYRSQHELVFIAKKGKASHRNNVMLGKYGRSRSNCWSYPGMNTFSAERAELLAMHPTSKNTAMLADAIRDASNRGEIVLDGFLGSGSTLIAAERTHRVCRGIELDPVYVDAIIGRWEKVTGREAVLQETGQSFEAVAAERRAERLVEPEATRADVVARTRTRTAV
jgi:DNA modification methylase